MHVPGDHHHIAKHNKTIKPRFLCSQVKCKLQTETQDWSEGPVGVWFWKWWRRGRGRRYRCWSKNIYRIGLVCFSLLGLILVRFYFLTLIFMKKLCRFGTRSPGAWLNTHESMFPRSCNKQQSMWVDCEHGADTETRLLTKDICSQDATVSIWRQSTGQLEQV